MRLILFTAFLCGCLATLVAGWTKEDQEIFRLRDEVEAAEGPGITFYDWLGIKPSASQSDINAAYHKKSRVLHPDKVKQQFIASRAIPRKKKGQSKSKTKPGVTVNKRPSEGEIKQVIKQANERFARLGIVAGILRGPGRARYDHFLSNGFPKWKGTGYYYSRFRPGLGTVLLGLFFFGGGAVHYGVLFLSWKRQREFVERYISHARRAAWGDDSSIGAIPGLGGIATPPVTPAGSSDVSMQGLNRRQKRLHEKEAKKARKSTKSGDENGTAEPASVVSAAGSSKKKVVAENGKVLVVDSMGNVYLEEDEDGETVEYLLDVDEIPLPTIRQTALFRLPIWLFNKTLGRVFGPRSQVMDAGHSAESAGSDSDEAATKTTTTAARASGHRKAAQRGRRSASGR